MALPQYIAFESNEKYLQYVTEEGETNKFLALNGKELVTPYSKFEVEVSRVHQGLVHIRCCYNNKYWARRSQSDRWIIGGADEADDDTSSLSCTLFNLVPVTPGDPKSAFRVLHVQPGQRYAPLVYNVDPAKPFDSCLHEEEEAAPGEDSAAHDVFTIIDMRSRAVLPPFMAFKGDNGRYLATRNSGGVQYLQFSGEDIGDPTVRFSVGADRQGGSVVLFAEEIKRFWRRDNRSWIRADLVSLSDTSTNRDTWFVPVMLSNNAIALRSARDNLFCKRYNRDWLGVGVSNITSDARMELEEAVRSRHINNVRFDLKNARIHGLRTILLSTSAAENKTSQNNTAKITLAYTTSESSTWSSTLSVKLGVTTTISSGVPGVSGASVEISSEFSGAYTWGEIKETSQTLTKEYEVVVPPMSKVTLRFIATVATCDVPFTYRQNDTLFDGKVVSREFNDGLFTGVNEFNFRVQTEEEKLDE